MSDISGPFSTLIEDWSGVTTTAVIPSGQRRWYNNVTGYNASEVIELVGNGTLTIANLTKRQPNTDGAQTLYGVKTFDSTPVIPIAAPTSNTQVSNKKYVDDQITANISLPDGYIYGLETSTDTDTDHDVLIATGKCKDYAGTTSMELTTAITKQIDATWAAGDDAGGLFSGTVAADTTYHLFLIRKDSDGTIDAGWDTDIDCTNIPTGYTAYRRVRSYLTDASANLVQTIDRGNGRIDLSTPTNAIDTTTPGTSRFSVSLPVPIGLKLLARTTLTVVNGGVGAYMLTPLDGADVTPTTVLNHGETNASVTRLTTTVDVYTNISGEIGARATDGALTNFVVNLFGWIDDRGQYGGK